MTDPIASIREEAPVARRREWRFRGRKEWLIIPVMLLAFFSQAFETLMMIPVSIPALSELLKLPVNHLVVAQWIGKSAWIAGLSAGVFGLLGGWLADSMGRKRLFGASLFLAVLSIFGAAYCNSLESYVFYRAMVAIAGGVQLAVGLAWVTEMFPARRSKSLALGGTQVFISLGGVFLVFAQAWVFRNESSLPAISVALGFNAHAGWRYMLLTGLVPLVPLIALVPFVPESPVWARWNAARDVVRPGLRTLFSPQYRKAALASMAICACASAAAVGALQLASRSVVPGLNELSTRRLAHEALKAEANGLNQQLTLVLTDYDSALASVPGLGEWLTRRQTVEAQIQAATVASDRDQLVLLRFSATSIDDHLEHILGKVPQVRETLRRHDQLLAELAANREKQSPIAGPIYDRGDRMQLGQEMGRFTGRLMLVFLLLAAISRVRLLQLFLVPGIALFAITYFQFYPAHGSRFSTGLFFGGFILAVQLSLLGAYVPQIFPVELRATATSFVFNVGGQLFGMMGAFLTHSVIAPRLHQPASFDQYAHAAGILGVGACVLALGVSFFLPEIKGEAEPAPR